MPALATCFFGQGGTQAISGLPVVLAPASLKDGNFGWVDEPLSNASGLITLHRRCPDGAWSVPVSVPPQCWTPMGIIATIPFTGPGPTPETVEEAGTYWITIQAPTGEWKTEAIDVRRVEGGSGYPPAHR